MPVKCRDSPRDHPLSINATASPTSSLLITSTGESGGTLLLDGNNGSGTFGVALSANNTITIDQNNTVENSSFSGNWTVTAPTVALNDGATLNTTSGSGPATLAMHTNNLILGNIGAGYATIKGNGITIDDTGMVTPGLTITANDENGDFIQAIIHSGSSGTLSISSSTNLLLTATNTANITYLNLDGDGGVSLSANQQVTVDTNVWAENSYSHGNWVVSAPTVALNDGATLYSGPMAQARQA